MESRSPASTSQPAPGLRILSGDLFASSCQTLVNPVNCAGLMGRGLALEFHRRFPRIFAPYEGRCRRRELRPGRPYVYCGGGAPWILLFPTKDHWSHRSKLADIVAGLEVVVASCEDWQLTSLAVPALGCGLGGLSWEVVRPVLVHHLSRLPIPVEIYAPVPAKPSPPRPTWSSLLANERAGVSPHSPKLPRRRLPDR